MDASRLHKALPTIDALTVAPDIGHMVRERSGAGFVVGVADDATLGIDDRRIAVIRQGAEPLVLRKIAIRRHAALALVCFVARRDRTDGLHSNPIRIGQHQVLSGRDIVLTRINRGPNRAGAHDAHGRGQ